MMVPLYGVPFIPKLGKILTLPLYRAHSSLNRAHGLLNRAHVYSHPRARVRANDLAKLEHDLVHGYKGSVSVFPSFGTNGTPYHWSVGTGYDGPTGLLVGFDCSTSLLV